MQTYKLVVAICFILISGGHLSAATFYVAPNGGTGAGTLSDPWSLSQANAKLTSGDKAVLRKGTYKTPIEPARSGTANSRIVYEAYPGETPVIHLGRVLSSSGWEKWSGTDGVDAVYRKKDSHGRDDGLVEDDIARAGRLSNMMNRSYTKTRIVETLNRVDAPGEYYHAGAYFYVRTSDSRSPANHTMTELKRGVRGIKVSDKRYITIRGITFRFMQQFTDARNAHYITVEDCTFEYGIGYVTFRILDGSSYWVIRNNTFRGAGTITGHRGDVIGPVGGSHHNIIENNLVEWYGHAGIHLIDSSYNYVRNNTISNGFGKGIIVGSDSKWNIIEDNDVSNIARAADLKRQHDSEHPALDISGDNNIWRFNRVWDTPQAMVHADSDTPGGGTGDDTKIYHNTSYGNTSTTKFSAGLKTVQAWFRNTKIVNNIFAESTVINGGFGQYGYNSKGKTSHNTFEIENNIFWSASSQNVINSKETVSQMDSGSKRANNNLSVNPQITSYSKQYPTFDLRSGSPAIDSGRFLTSTTSSGGGKTVPVQDASFFSDGHGIIAGDVVKVGANVPVQIATIDYASNTLTLTTAINWSSGDGVGFDYAGQAPDIGAYELGGNSSTSLGVAPPMPPVLQ